MTGSYVRNDEQAAKSNISFVLGVAGVEGLGERLGEVQAFDADSAELSLRRLVAGEYLAPRPPVRWSYDIDLRPPANRLASPHLSWLGNAGGLLMLGDLLPFEGRRERSARVKVVLPEGWRAVSTYKAGPDGSMVIPDVSRAVIAILREGERPIEFRSRRGTKYEMLITGEWQFTRADAEGMLREIAEEYEKLFDRGPAENVLVNLLPFPQGGGVGEWAAETRGQTVTIVSGDTPFKTQSTQRLHEQLRHELFHLWLPNGVKLTGNYDWFYEGAALYHSLKTGARLGRISFTNFLETLSRAAAIEARMPAGSQLMSSGGRWSGNSTGVYARGILTAFALDLAMQDASRGKRSMDGFLKRLYTENREREADGNATILRMLGEAPETTLIAERHIKGSDRLELGKLALPAGILWDGRRFTLSEKPNGRQRAILRDLGYNSERRRPRYQNEK
ncbi:MAG: hypothetical protein IPM21_01935 [Acidobacteria bacterium]|nr:hypothetical protein [Acidobacteriota bacterium]